MNLNQRRPTGTHALRNHRASKADVVRAAGGRPLTRTVVNRGKWNEVTTWAVDGRVVLVVGKGERPNWDAVVTAL